MRTILVYKSIKFCRNFFAYDLVGTPNLDENANFNTDFFLNRNRNRKTGLSIIRTRNDWWFIRIMDETQLVQIKVIRSENYIRFERTIELELWINVTSQQRLWSIWIGCISSSTGCKVAKVRRKKCCAISAHPR